jgi:hypothetical protein
MLRVSQCRVLLATFFCDDRNPLRFAIDICARHRPEGNQIDSGHELGKKRWQKFRVPAKELNQHGCDTEIEFLISGRSSAFDEMGARKREPGKIVMV